MIAAPAFGAPPTPQPYRAHDGLGFRNILPPGQNGLDNLDQLAAFRSLGQRPPHNNDQLGMYGNLVYAVPGLTAAKLSKYFKDASFGVPLGDVERKYSPRGDANNYVAGINRYVDEAKMNPAKMPGESPAINRPQGPDPWNTRDIIATAALVGGIFGGGGGGELQSAQVLQALQARLGNRRGRGAWSDFRSANDPQAPTTVVGRKVPYQVPPTKLAEGNLAIPDRGTLAYQPVGGSASAKD